jgi:hypothetical protein
MPGLISFGPAVVAAGASARLVLGSRAGAGDRDGAVAATLVDEFGADAPLLDIGGRALRELTRISGSPYSMWRDVAITNKINLANALLKIEQRLAHIRENLDTKQLADEFELAHLLRKTPPRKVKK